MQIHTYCQSFDTIATALNKLNNFKNLTGIFSVFKLGRQILEVIYRWHIFLFGFFFRKFICVK